MDKNSRIKTASPPIEDYLFDLRDLIHERTGLFFPDGEGLKGIVHLLAPVFEKHGIDSIGVFCRLLEAQETTAPAWRDTFSALTKPASSFYRQQRLMPVLTGSVLPEIFERGNRKRLKIWSAGCSTGEEPFSVAMALNDGGWFDRAEIEIYASDASASAIEAARKGVYKNYRMGLTDEARDKYFRPLHDEWHISPDLRERIQWSVINIFNEKEISPFVDADIIFCRNVFIYFSDSAIIKTLSLFAKYMPAGGHLFTDQGDYFDALIGETGLFETQEINGVPIRIRRGGNSL